MKQYIDKFVRDSNNPGAVLNTDQDALEAYKLRKKNANKLHQLEKEVSDIKNMLSLILTKLG